MRCLREPSILADDHLEFVGEWRRPEQCSCVKQRPNEVNGRGLEQRERHSPAAALDFWQGRRPDSSNGIISRQRDWEPRHSLRGQFSSARCWSDKRRELRGRPATRWRLAGRAPIRAGPGTKAALGADLVVADVWRARDAMQMRARQ